MFSLGHFPYKQNEQPSDNINIMLIGEELAEMQFYNAKSQELNNEMFGPKSSFIYEMIYIGKYCFDSFQ